MNEKTLNFLRLFVLGIIPEVFLIDACPEITGLGAIITGVIFGIFISIIKIIE